jgi:exodeoxyribonuclease VII large subunit
MTTIQFPLTAPETWTVSGLTAYIKDLLDLDPELEDVWLTGEISNPRQYPSGHLYFTLKDANASLSCVMWRSAAGRLPWQPQQGDAVRAHGHVSVYEARGSYQLYVDQLYPAGTGDLHARYEALRDRLKVEGLFDAERKQALPAFPHTIGVVTSSQAAALRDVLQVLRRRYPLVRVLLAPSLVQGDQAPAQIVAALRTLDARDDVDQILLVRGGGSLEELWAFNDEQVARAVAACRHPVISGVGHETDFTIADFVADLRAPTPSAAAELAVRDQIELRQQIVSWVGQLEASIQGRIGQARQSVDLQGRALQRLSPRSRVDGHRQETDELARRLDQALSHKLALHRTGLVGLQARLSALGPLATLERGYAIVRREDSGAVIRSVEQVSAGAPLAIQVRDGQFGAVTRSDE